MNRAGAMALEIPFIVQSLITPTTLRTNCKEHLLLRSQYQKLLEQFGMVALMLRRGNCYENAPWKALETSRVNTTERLNDQSEVNKSDKHHIEFLKAREDARKPLSLRNTFNFITALVHRAIVFLRIDAVALGRDHRHKAKIKCELTRFIPFIGTVRQQIQGRSGGPSRFSSARPSGASCA